jgi:hypothetical protein
MNTVKATHGGARKHAGAPKKPKKLRKIPITTYHRLIDVQVIGIESARRIAKNAIESKIKKV